MPLNGLALCAGVGGLELGLRLALGPAYRTVGYVERDAYAAATLVARMDDAALDRAPIWDDVATFDGRPWRGIVDIISGGFPCQPWSVAGKRAGTTDARWIWSDIARTISDIRPRYVYLENVPPIVRGGLEYVLGDLAAGGFDAEWDCFTAAQVGAPHLRERLFILARDGKVLADGPGARLEGPDRENQRRRGTAGNGTDMADAERSGHDWGARVEERGSEYGTVIARTGAPALFPPRPEAVSLWHGVSADLEPAFCRVADGLAHRVDRLRLAGNGVVPLVAAHAFRELWGRICE